MSIKKYLVTCNYSKPEKTEYNVYAANLADAKIIGEKMFKDSYNFVVELGIVTAKEAK